MFAPAGADALEADLDWGVEDDGDGRHTHSMSQMHLQHKQLASKSKYCNDRESYMAVAAAAASQYPCAALIRVEVAAIDYHAVSFLHGSLSCSQAFWP